ncbi:hypothetical protein AGMMS49545_19090 [Betaproteobacteria bacterium]|nr:hypothetical protein AGMMS49545_19090 [Betaproteobacteria bacterium]
MCERGIGFEPGSAGGIKGGFKIFRAEPNPPAGTPALPATANLAASVADNPCQAFGHGTPCPMAAKPPLMPVT